MTYDTAAISRQQAATKTAAAWLLFIHHLPPKPDYLRVKVRRRLAKFGAVLVKPSVYALPASDEGLEDFEWLRREIVDTGGEAIVCSVELVSGLSNEALTALFVTDRQQDYFELEREATSLISIMEGDDTARANAAVSLSRLQRRLADLRGIDFFGAPGRARAEKVIAELESVINPRNNVAQHRDAVLTESGKIWVTRRGVKVDRMASAWLIRRFIDPYAQFVFVDPREYSHVDGHLRFDMFDGEYTHEHDACTFETLLRRFNLDDPALKALAEIVHDLDYKDTKYARAESMGVAAMIAGIVAEHPTDEARLAAGALLFNALYASLTPDQA